jgi:hypothetical protein
MITGFIVLAIFALSVCSFNFDRALLKSKALDVCINKTQIDAVLKGTDINARIASIHLSIPFAIVTAYFQQPQLFPTWNYDYTEVFFMQCNERALFLVLLILLPIG